MTNLYDACGRFEAMALAEEGRLLGIAPIPTQAASNPAPVEGR
jgi:hypothetical protein